MSIEKRGNMWRVTYRYKKKVYREMFASEKQALARDAIIKAEKESGDFVPPHNLINEETDPRAFGKRITVRELMDRLVDEYGPTEWKPNILAQNARRIEYYINPAIGDELVMDISVRRIERFYRELLMTPSADDPNATVGKSVIEKVHTLLNTAFRQAQRWGYIPREEKTVVSLAKRPMYRSEEREIWTPEEFRIALDTCDHHGLLLWLYLAASCSARIGELLGLQWKYVQFLDDGTSCITFRQQLQRLDCEGMKCSEKYEVYLSFPQTGRGKTVLALCGMKCRDGVTAPPRKVYVGPLVTAKLKEEKARQASLKSVFGDAYQDFDIVIAQDLGRPYEEHDIRKHLKELCKKSNLPVIVPHAMRHLSVTLKLLMSGDVKAVQADSGHKDAQMVYNRYSHALDTERRKLALDFDTALYSGNAV